MQTDYEIVRQGIDPIVPVVVLIQVMEFLASQNLAGKPVNYRAMRSISENNCLWIKEYSHFSLCITGIIEG
jgi:hypothetical protein